MSGPHRFGWIERPYLAAMARPSSMEELEWLRKQGIQIVLTLSENPLHRNWVNEAGLMAVHVPVPDMGAPSPEQLDLALDTIRRARDQKMGVSVHCVAGLGRTGTLLAAWYVDQGSKPDDAISRVRKLRPGSVETFEQEEAIRDFARRLKRGDGDEP